LRYRAIHTKPRAIETRIKEVERTLIVMVTAGEEKADNEEELSSVGVAEAE
jgi:hypothetical protein